MNFEEKSGTWENMARRSVLFRTVLEVWGCWSYGENKWSWVSHFRNENHSCLVFYVCLDCIQTVSSPLVLVLHTRHVQTSIVCIHHFFLKTANHMEATNVDCKGNLRSNFGREFGWIFPTIKVTGCWADTLQRMWPTTVSPIIMEVDNIYMWKATTIFRDRFFTSMLGGRVGFLTSKSSDAMSKSIVGSWVILMASLVCSPGNLVPLWVWSNRQRCERPGGACGSNIDRSPCRNTTWPNV